MSLIVVYDGQNFLHRAQNCLLDIVDEDGRIPKTSRLRNHAYDVVAETLTVWPEYTLLYQDTDISAIFVPHTIHRLQFSIG